MKEHDLLRAALEYAAQGLHVIPLKPRDKVPLTAHGGKDATTDPAQIRAWWTQWPDANIGIATGKVSGFWVLDLDGAYPDTWPPLGIEPTVKTARGVHYYFRCPEGTEIKNRTKIRGEKIDVRGDGGYDSGHGQHGYAVRQRLGYEDRYFRCIMQLGNGRRFSYAQALHR